MAGPDDENAWIARSLKGDHEAFTELVTRYQKMIHALTFRMTGSMSDAEDLAQEAFIRAYQQLHTFEGGSKFSSWLYRIAMNACLNWRQREFRRGEVHNEWAANRMIESGDPSGKDSNSEDVQRALMRLPAKQRAAVVLTLCDGLSHAEAARVLGCSETTVSWRLFAARGKLRQWLAKGDQS